MDKPLARHGKRDAPATAPSEARGGAAGGERGGRAGRARGRGGFSGNEGGRSYSLQPGAACRKNLYAVATAICI